MAYFETKNPNLGKFLRDLEDEDVGVCLAFRPIFAIWYILWPFGKFYCYLVYIFYRFGMFW
jgi:hypothetical protein